MSFTNINFFLIIAAISLNLIIIFNIKKINKIINIWDYPDKIRKIHLKINISAKENDVIDNMKLVLKINKKNYL